MAPGVRQFARRRAIKVVVLRKAPRRGREGTVAKRLTSSSMPFAKVQSDAEEPLVQISSSPYDHFDTETVPIHTHVVETGETLNSTSCNSDASCQFSVSASTQQLVDELERENRALRRRQELQAANRHYVSKRGRWLFTADYPRLNDISGEEYYAWQQQKRFHDSLKTSSPDGYFYLCLMVLPREIRDMIWTAYTDDLPQNMVVRTRFCKSGNPSPLDDPKWLPPLCFTSQQFFDECVPALLRQRIIKIGHESIHVFSKFL